MVKPVAEIAKVERCECGTAAERSFVPSRIHIHGAAVEHAEWNPGLGCVTKNKRDREEIAKRKGLVEVGNDYKSGDTIQKTFDTAREEKRKKDWDAL